MIGLVEFLEQFGDSVEADLQRYYQVDLRDLFRESGKLTWRRLKVLISKLPHDSSTSLAVHGSEVLWTDTQELIATACDILMQANWQRGGGKGQRPKPIKRPYEGSKATSPEDAKERARAAAAKAKQDQDVLSQEQFDRIVFGV